MIKLKINKSDAANAADFIEYYFFQNIRDNECIDDIEYVKSLLKCMDELRDASK